MRHTDVNSKMTKSAHIHAVKSADLLISWYSHLWNQVILVANVRPRPSKTPYAPRGKNTISAVGADSAQKAVLFQHSVFYFILFFHYS